MVEKTQSSDINVFNFKKYILFSHEKELNSAICRDISGPRDCHIEWSKSETEKYISYINTYVWNLENGIDGFAK